MMPASPVERALSLLAPFGPHIVRVPERAGAYAPLSPQIHPRLAEALRTSGVTALYRHQALAIDAALRGNDVLVTSSTNSGKSLCAQVPALHAALTEPACRCLFLYPTKALAQDQLRSLDRFAAPLGLHAATYDGDTPRARRGIVRSEAHFLLTNPDMLHAGILGGFEHWERLLKRVRWIVLDESHSYRGVFGTHVAHVIRRFLRLAQWYGSNPRVIALSATLADADKHFEALVGREAAWIDADDAPQPERVHAFLPAPTSGSVHRPAGELLAAFAEAGVKTLAFSSTRAGAELVLRHARAHLAGESPDLLEAYRGGYTATDRRKIEKRLREGRLRGVSATNALELGIDLGDLDAVIVNGFPGRVSSYRQQIGRAGRGLRPSISVFVGRRHPVDAHYLANPNLLFGVSERVPIRPANPQILRSHLLCACAERPMGVDERVKFWPNSESVVRSMVEEGSLSETGGRLYFPSHTSPTRAVSLRSTGGSPIRLLREGTELATEDRSWGRFSVYPGAILLVRGETYVVTAVDGSDANVEPTTSDVYSLPLVESTVRPEVDMVAEGAFRLQTVRVTETARTSGRRSLSTDDLVQVNDLAATTHTYVTVATRIDLPDLGVSDAGHVGGIHALEHVLVGMAGVVAGADPADLGSCWYTELPDSPAGALFVYDRAEGGSGVAEALYVARTAWIRAALDRLTQCRCAGACPMCLLAFHCPFGNECLDKAAAVQFLTFLS